MDDREKVLGAVRRALKTGYLPGAEEALPRDLAEGVEARTLTPSAATSRRDGEKGEEGTRDEWIARFKRELEPLGGETWVVGSESEAIEKVMELVAKAGRQEVLCWSDEELGVSGVGDELARGGYTNLTVELPGDAEGRKAALMELEKARVGITGAMAALADTGSIVVTSGARRPRLASLLPTTHIALLRASAMYPTLGAFLAANPAVLTDSANVVVITGPSRTADIELTLTRGVHGPREVNVIIIEG